jgi:hypothetical protein
MDPLVKNILLYTLSILAGALAAGLGVLATQLAGADPINWRPVIAAAIGPIVAGLAASRLPRPEGAALAAQIDTLKDQGIARRDMVVVTQEEAVKGMQNAPPPDGDRMPQDAPPSRPRPRPRLEDAS